MELTNIPSIDPFTFQNFINWSFYTLIGFCGVFMVRILRDLKDSIVQLNIKVAVVIEKVTSHEKRLDGLDEDLKTLRKTKTKS